ncbi:MAG TPA: hypothetical protein VNK70_01480 [Candidatus Paceibacterota bacterium]|nr:hypothetical protein [Candidatus Paceibacterota bacterium]
MSIDLNRIYKDGMERLHRLQRADNKTKKRYLIAWSALAMVMVIVSWVLYLGFTLPSLAPAAPEAAVPASAEAESESFFSVIGRGALNLKNALFSEFTELKENIASGVGSIIARFRENKEFTIEP